MGVAEGSWGCNGGAGVISGERMTNRIFMIHLHDKQIQAVCPTALAGAEGLLVTQEMVWHLDKAEMKMESVTQPNGHQAYNIFHKKMTLLIRFLSLFFSITTVSVLGAHHLTMH